MPIKSKKYLKNIYVVIDKTNRSNVVAVMISITFRNLWYVVDDRPVRAASSKRLIWLPFSEWNPTTVLTK